MKNKKVFPWLWKNSKKSRLYILLLTILSILFSLIQLMFVSASKNVIDIAIGAADGNLIGSALILLALLILQLTMQILINFTDVHATSRFEINLKKNIFRRMMNKDYLSITKHHSGELLNFLDSDVNIIVTGIIGIVPSLALFLTSIVGGVIMLWNIDNFLAVLILIIGPCLALGARIYSSKYKKLHKECQTADGNTKSFMLEMLQNLLVVKSFESEDNVIKKAEDLQKKSYRLRVKRAVVSVAASVGMFLIFNAGYYFALAYGAFKLSVGLMTFGDVTAILQLVSKIQAPFKNVSGLIPQAFSVLASAERLIDIESIKDEENSGDYIKEEITDDFRIVFNMASFKYSDDSVVSNIDMTVKKGEFVAIAGESGAGKSTALKLLLGIFKPISGEIYIKDGDKKYEVGKNTRNIFSYVPQGNMIISGTIRENISFAKPDSTDEEIWKACDISVIGDFIRGLDKGLDTEIGENGIGLSEGQAQRISVARAVLMDAPVLLMDEATSALDTETEIKLLNNIRSMTDKTCLFVSHKQNTIDISDKVVYINKGEI